MAVVIDLAAWRLSHPKVTATQDEMITAWEFYVRFWLAMWGFR